MAENLQASPVGAGRLLLFDIDGTLLLSGGAGVRAMTLAFEQVFGVRDAFRSADIAGRTDTFILSTAFAGAGVPDHPENHQRFRDAYIPVLSAEIEKAGSGRRGLMPGILALLSSLQNRQGVHLALLTGNFEAAAYLKLAAFGIAEFFAWGAFGEESAERAELARVALRRAESRAIPPHGHERVWVIGDTPHDIACAHAVGAQALAVATGLYSVDELTAAGGDVVLADLSETEDVIRLLLTGGSAWESCRSRRAAGDADLPDD